MNNSATTLLPAGLELGRVHLTIADLERSIDFYRNAIGLVLIDRGDGRAVLGVGQRALLLLSEVPGARRAPWRTGLYHYALLLPDRAELGRTLRNLVATNTRLTGGADHLVSEALYLDDPDGHGIELYRDRPREEWPQQNGRVQMDTLPLDYEALLADAGGARASRFSLHADTIMGHVHLHVAHLAEAVQFYADIIGFDLQMQMGGSAAFMSVGGYHHHLGLNTWAGVGALPPPQGSVALQDYEIILPAREDLNTLIGRLQRGQWSYTTEPDALLVRDPAQNAIRFSVR